MLDKAIRIAAEAFEGKFDKGGKPYILHCLHVMNQFKDEKTRIVAVLHDLIEDCKDWDEQRLLDEGFSMEIVTCISLLTHKDEDSYDDYIKKIATSETAKKVKKADLRHNSDITRIKGLRQKDFERIEKYHRAYVYLSE